MRGGHNGQKSTKASLWCSWHQDFWDVRSWSSWERSCCTTMLPSTI